MAEKCLFNSNIIGRIDGEERTINVKINESLFCKQTSNRGRIGEPVYVFGGTERQTRRCFLEPVINRTRKTLVEVVIRRINPGSKIISNKWSAYTILYHSSTYQHSKVNYSSILLIQMISISILII